MRAEFPDKLDDFRLPLTREEYNAGVSEDRPVSPLRFAYILNELEIASTSLQSQVAEAVANTSAANSTLEALNNAVNSLEALSAYLTELAAATQNRLVYLTSAGKLNTTWIEVDEYGSFIKMPFLELYSDNGDGWPYLTGKGSGARWEIGAVDALGAGNFGFNATDGEDIVFGIDSDEILRMHTAGIISKVNHEFTNGFKTATTLHGGYAPFQNAELLLFAEKGEKFRWLTPVSAQFYDHGEVSWATWGSPPDFKKLTDGKGDTSIAVDYTHRRFRLTYQLSQYHMVEWIVIQQLYQERALKITIEESADNSTWTVRYAEQSVASSSSPQIVVSPTNRQALFEQYIRITIEVVGLGVADTWHFAGLQAWTMRTGDQGGVGLHTQLPFSWDESRNITLPGTLTVDGFTTVTDDMLVQGLGGYNGSGDTASLYIGDLNVRLKAAWGSGFSISVAGVTDALTIAENTGLATLSGSLELSGSQTISIAGNQVIQERIAGWEAATGTAERKTFDTDTADVREVAMRLKALIDDLMTHGLIGI